MDCRSIVRGLASPLLLTVVIASGSGQSFAQPTTTPMSSSPNPGDEPPRALAGRGLDNLVAFTRLLGYVRYFHPSDEAAATDWTCFAVENIASAENARDSAELARTLESEFRRVAPTLRVFETAGPRPETPEALRRGTTPGAARTIAWRHRGTTEVESELPEYSRYRSWRVKSDDPPEKGTAFLYTDVDAAPYRGHRVRLHATIRGALEGAGSGAHLEIDVTGEGNKRVASKETKVERIPERGQTEEESTVEVPAEARSITVAVRLEGFGRVEFEAVTLEATGTGEGGSAGAPVTPRVLEFVVGPQQSKPDGWKFEEYPRNSAYTIEVPKTCAGGTKACIAFSRRLPDPLLLPEPASPFLVDLEGGVSCLVPLALYLDADGTLPHGTPVATGATDGNGIHSYAGRPDGWVPSGNDRATRLATVALAWNVPQHFYPYFDVVGTDWRQVLRRTLVSAASDPDDRTFLDTLRRMIAELHDGHAAAGNVIAMQDHALPILWEWIEDRLVVTHVMEGVTGVKRGDVVVAIDGRPVADALREADSLVSGSTPQSVRWKALQDLATGAKGSAVTIDLSPGASARPAQTPRTVTLERTVSGPEFQKLREPRPANFSEISPGIRYLDVDTLDTTDFVAHVKELAEARGLIVDVRGYPRLFDATELLGHLTDVRLPSPNYYIPLVTRPDAGTMQFDSSKWWVDPKSPRFKGKSVFLIDQRAQSAAENLLTIVEHSHLGELVGSRTAGTNGTVFLGVQLPGGYQDMWTLMKVLKPDGSRFHGVGILPTVPVSRTIAGIRADRDEVLERAIEVVSAP